MYHTKFYKADPLYAANPIPMKVDGSQAFPHSGHVIGTDRPSDTRPKTSQYLEHKPFVIGAPTPGKRVGSMSAVDHLPGPAKIRLTKRST